jgi:tetratricopeptide (TPR) repeat protein
MTIANTASLPKRTRCASNNCLPSGSSIWQHAGVSNSTDWNRVEAALDELLALPTAERQAAIAHLAGSNAPMRAEIESLLNYVDGGDELLDGAAVDAITTPEPPGKLSPGHIVGSYRIVSLVGRGGMGEVYKAERIAGDFRQIVALKLVRSDAVGSIDRFHAERQILAELDHPGIARLLDGGVTTDGRPYMAMEFVDGHDLMHHCIVHRLSLQERLDLFDQVCEAVAYAHRHLVVHRDLKPSNIYVNTEGRVKLLDFGIAKLLAPNTLGDATYTAHMSPAYAAPEQLTGGAITTATDVYGLGATLYQLVCGQPPRDVSNLPFAAALHRILDSKLVPASQAVKGDWPVSTRQLQGDIDAIAAMALRREPEARYVSARALAEDLARHHRNEPVRARVGARAYVVRRFIRRNWRPLSATAAIFVLLIVGMTGIGWQWLRAQREAQRATATKNFLLSIFNASDPRSAQDKPRAQITARELLDASTDRIEKEFANDPDLEIELLGSVAQIYRELDEPERYQTLQRRQVEIARKRYGTLHTVVIDALLDDSTDAVLKNDYGKALKLLAVADPLIRRAGLDRSAWRARYWLGLGQALISDPSSAAARTDALQRSVNLFAALPTTEPGYVTSLTDLGNIYQASRELPKAIAYYSQAIKMSESVSNRNDAELLTVYSNMAQAQWNNGDFSDAENSYDHAADIGRKTYGAQHRNFWIPTATHARMVHLLGDRERALAMFDSLLERLPPESAKDHDAAEVREWYGGCLAAEGRPQLAIPLLEASERGYLAAPEYDFEVTRLRLTLGDAYDRVGRAQDARRALKAALDSRVGTSPPDFQPLLAIRERWGRFLLGQGDTVGAQAQFQEIVAQAHGHRWAHVALAYGDLARLAVLNRDATTAVQAAATAVELFEHVEGFRDVRMGPALWRINAQALLLSGDHSAARQWAQRAVDADSQYDDPSSADLADARVTLHQAERTGVPAK